MPIPIAAILGGIMGGMGFANMFPPLTRWGQYGLNRLWRNEIIDPTQAVEALYRGIIDDKDLDYELGSLGLNKERIAWLSDLRHQLFGTIEAIILWRRELISDDDLNTRLHMIGIPENDMTLWRKFTETRPGVQDIIRFAVREVYTPAIAEKFGQYEGSDEVAATASLDLKAAGIRPEDLKKYWAAHWELPSLTMGYEMLHRGIITLDELKLLMRALDVMPFWRDKLIEISYNPLTRVDVRRMHKFGVLTDADLLKSYKDIGYNDENAKRMADFTIAYNKDPNESESTETDKQRDLTKADIINGYSDGLFTEQEAGDALMTLGYSQDEVDYYFARVAFLKDRDKANTFIKAYRAAYLGNTMTYNEIVDALNQLNLSADRVKNLFNIWDIEKSVKTLKPTKAEILTFLRKGLIDKDMANSELLGMGYAQRYVDLYLATA